MPLQTDRADPGADGTTRKAHYGDGEQPWDAIKRLGWAPQFAASNVLKYLRRTKDLAHSLESARWYWQALKALINRNDSPKSVFQAADVMATLMGELTDAELKLLQ